MKNLPKLAQPRGRVYASFQDTIGGTPLVGIPRLSRELDLGATVLLKLESFNPLASVKDRAAIAMIETAERNGVITRGKTTLIEPTSGNTGISLVAIAAARGYAIKIVMPESASIERRKMMALLGAEIVLTPAAEGMKGAIAKARELESQIDNAWIPQQFENAANPAIHEVSTAEEIWRDTDGKVDIVISGIGTGGTVTGIGKRLKALDKNIEIIGVEPAESPFLTQGKAAPHKIQGLGAGFEPAILDLSAVDRVIPVEGEKAFETARLLARKEGLPLGISSGAALYAALETAKLPANKGKTIVAIMPDFAERYVSTPLFS